MRYASYHFMAGRHKGLAIVAALFFLQLLSSINVAVGMEESATPREQHVLKYNVCNGLSNQLLIHASAIALAIQKKSDTTYGKVDVVVQVPDYFIVNGEQSSDAPILPDTNNSVSLGKVFNITFLQERLEQKGIQMELVRWHDDIKEKLESISTNATDVFDDNPTSNGNLISVYDSDSDSDDANNMTYVSNSSTHSNSNSNSNSNTNNNPPICPELSWLPGADPELVLYIIESFKPSSTILALTNSIMEPLRAKGFEQGVCFHHRDGNDWHDHCQRWQKASLHDNVYRGNCEAVDSGNSSLLELLESRALTSKDRWIYYCGDSDIPKELKEQDKYSVLNKHQIMTKQAKRAVQAIKPNANVRDIWALIDFSICSNLRYLVGNSVSTFTAIQTALRRQEGAYWYNSQSIPLGIIWDIYSVPIVYTYTELSDPKGKLMLQASIASVRRHMPMNKIHLLYHGTQDKDFQRWLQTQQVTIVQHVPKWKNAIERMRRNGNADTSHLFLHAGNYFGTWQRIDIPKFIETEYCLLLDADTVIIQPFTLSDFGLNLTYSIGMAAERHRHHQGDLLNAGVTLMNVPHMRATYDRFLSFILEHVYEPTFEHPAPSDQGAYLDFYAKNVRQISNEWNWKAYWGVKEKNRMFSKIKIIHFHGIKPHDYVNKLLGGSCPKAIRHLCRMFNRRIFKLTIERFLLAGSSIPNFNRNYCEVSFDDSQKQNECTSILKSLSSLENPEQQQQQIMQIGTSSQAKKRRRRYLALEGFVDGDHTGLNKNVVTVSRPAERMQEESNRRVIRELSYDYLSIASASDIEDMREMKHEEAQQPMSLLRLQFHMMFLCGTITFLFLKVFLRKQRRLIFILVCGSITWRHLLALNNFTAEGFG
mgnify:CR=1 FL=1